MDILFERGDQQRPKGHAILYFRSTSDPEEIWATYVLVLPISVDVTKYVPPFLMNQVGEMDATDLSAFAFPPAPDQLESYNYMEDLADLREDDILYGGTINPEDVAYGMMAVGEAVQGYTDAYVQATETELSSHNFGGALDEGLAYNDVMYGLMSDGDRLSELTKLIGKLRFASEGNEDSLAREAETDIYQISNHLPDDHLIDKLIESAKAGGERGESLASLYLQRCFLLVQQDFANLVDIEAKIKAIEDDATV